MARKRRNRSRSSGSSVRSVDEASMSRSSSRERVSRRKRKRSREGSRDRSRRDRSRERDHQRSPSRESREKDRERRRGGRDRDRDTRGGGSSRGSRKGGAGDDRGGSEGRGSGGRRRRRLPSRSRSRSRSWSRSPERRQGRARGQEGRGGRGRTREEKAANGGGSGGGGGGGSPKGSRSHSRSWSRSPERRQGRARGQEGRGGRGRTREEKAANGGGSGGGGGGGSPKGSRSHSRSWSRSPERRQGRARGQEGRGGRGRAREEKAANGGGGGGGGSPKGGGGEPAESKAGASGGEGGGGGGAAAAPARPPKAGLAANLTGRTGGVYVPPFKLAMMREQMAKQGKHTKEFQRMSWEALRKSINGLINKVNVGNIKNLVPELLQENLVRGRGLFARALMKAQLASPGFTHIYAALVAVINTRLPENGELLLKRVIFAFRRAYKRRDKVTATALSRFIAHLVNQQVAHELLALQLLTVLLEEPTDDSVEIAVAFVKEVGQLLEELSPQGLHAIFERFRGILHEGDIDKRVQYTIEGLFAVRKAGFEDHPAVPPELDLVERSEQITFELGLDDDLQREEMLDVFRFDPDYEQNEKMWVAIRKEILGEEEGDSDDDEGEDGSEGDDESGSDDEEEGEGADGEGDVDKNAPDAVVHDLTEQDLVNLRRTIYLTIMSSLGFEECAHKLMKLRIPDGLESELCNMLVECCCQERTYLRYYGLLGQRFCLVARKWQEAFDAAFYEQYATVHRLETNKLRNCAKFFAHLLHSDALPWTCLEYVKLNEEDTTSSSRIFIKILCQELSENLGLLRLKERLNDPVMAQIFAGLFPKENPRNTRFAINFFTSIGLGGLTDGLRTHLKNAPKMIMKQAAMEQMAAGGGPGAAADSSSDSSSSSSSDSSSDSDSSSSSSSSSSSDSD